MAALALLASPGLQGQSPEEAAVQVIGTPGCGPQSQGSGVVIASGVVATNAHVVQGAERVQVRWRDHLLWASDFILAPDQDLCLLRVPALPAAPARLAEAPSFQAGMGLRTVGFPSGTGPVASEGVLVATWRFRGSSILQATLPTRHGSSGGGVYDAQDRLLGLTTFSILAMESHCFAVPATWAQELLTRPWQAGNAIPVCKPREVLLHEFLERMTEDPANRVPWEAFVRAWVAQRPKDPEAWFGLGQALWARVQVTAERGEGSPDPGLTEASIQAYRTAVELSPGHARAWNNLGATYDAIGAYPEALRAFGMALRLNPGYALAWLNLGATYINLARHAEARDALRRGLEGQPDDAVAWARLGHCEGALGHWDASAKAFGIAVRLRPIRFDWWEDQAQALFRARDREGLAALLGDLERRFPGRSIEVRKRLSSR
jgi:hypothetical protein